eukprot:7391816-Prymnesium_polylepis.1
MGGDAATRKCECEEFSGNSIAAEAQSCCEHNGLTLSIRRLRTYSSAVPLNCVSGPLDCGPDA